MSGARPEVSRREDLINKGGIPMAKKKPPIPDELSAFVKQGHTTFPCADGDWDLRIEDGYDSPVKFDLPSRSTVIAENGCGDFLFLRTTTAGKFDPKVYVFWHEEDNHEVFAKRLKELTEAKPRPQSAARKPASKKSTDAGALKKLVKALASSESSVREKALREFGKAEFGLEALPALRQALADDDVGPVEVAAQCIAKLEPSALTCPEGQKSLPVSNAKADIADLESQLLLQGSKVWSYSHFPNCYPACLQALVNLKVDDEVLVEYVQMHIGLGADMLSESLKALQQIGTPEARDLAKRAVAFWKPELNMRQAKEAQALLAAPKTAKKK